MFMICCFHNEGMYIYIWITLEVGQLIYCPFSDLYGKKYRHCIDFILMREMCKNNLFALYVFVLWNIKSN